MPSRIPTYKLYAAFAIAYVVILMLMPANSVTMRAYHLNNLSYRVLLLLASAIPALLTWAAAFYGYEQLRHYSGLVQDTKEGNAYARLTTGVAWLALYLPVISIISILLMAIANAHSGFRSTSLIISNYATIIIAVIAFSIINRAGRMAADISGARPSLRLTRAASLAFIILGVVYCYLLISRVVQHPNPYHLGLHLLLFTVVIPYLYAWFLGLLALLDIHAFGLAMPGVLYHKALTYLCGGLLLIIATSILIQYLNSANTHRGRLILGGVLLVRYLLYVILAVGFVVIGWSAKKLQRIEKV